MKVGSYRKKPLVVQALQLRWDSWNEMCDFAGVGKLTDGKPEGCYLDPDGKPMPDGQTSERLGLLIPTLDGLMIGAEYDWIVQEPVGTADRKFYPCKESIFKATYEPAL